MSKVIREKTLERCAICCRKNPHRPLVTVQTEREDEIFVLTSRLCGDSLRERCAPYTPEERADPYFKSRWTKTPPPEELDPGIRDLVLRCNTAGIQTVFSCDGHSYGYGYIDFWDEADRERAVKVLLVERPGPMNVRSHLLGEIYRLTIPKDCIVGAVPKPRRPRRNPRGESGSR